MSSIFIHDVVARDGFQIEPAWVPTERKIEIIDRLAQTGVAKIEATSFVSPKAVPNLRDAEAVMAGIRRNPDVTYVALVPNARGAERALGAASTRSCWSSPRRRRTTAPTSGAALPNRSPVLAKCSRQYVVAT